MKIGAPVYLTGAYVLAQIALFVAALLASDRSYTVWATAGAASCIMSLFGGLVGFIVLIGGLLGKSSTAIACGFVLTMFCAIPMGLLLVGGALLGL